ncbi:MAG TPA: hypothetical protein VFE36_02145 [Candidatus Baltobacteraceae bacterium]|nr:hypothetical protein [Candidatus Baltobacteraceae bacterium]
MKTALVVLSILLIAATPATPPPASKAPPGAPSLPSAYVPRGTVIPVTVTKDIRVGGAGTNSEAHKVKMEVTQDVIVNGYTIVKAGDLAEGEYTNQNNITKRVFSTNESQEVALDVDDIINFCGDTLHMTFERTFVGGARGGFMSFGVHAHDAVFAKGSILKAATDRPERTICAEKTTATPAPLPSPMILTDEDAQAEASPSPQP